MMQDQVVRDIYREWPQLQADRKDQFNPLTLALELLDAQTNAQSHQQQTPERFMTAMDRMETVIDRLVDEHYEAFNESVDTFAGVCETVQGALSSVQLQKSLLQNCHDQLFNLQNNNTTNYAAEVLGGGGAELGNGDASADDDTNNDQQLMSLWTKSVQLKEMLRMLSQIDQLRTAPAQIEQLVSQQSYLQAVKLLLKSLKSVAGLSEVGALSEISSQLTSLRDSIYEQLLEDLNQALYGLNGFYDAKMFGLSASSTDQQGDINFEDGSLQRPRQHRPRKHHSRAKSIEPNAQNNEQKQVGSDNLLGFVEQLVNSLSLLDKLQDAALAIKQRMSYEFFNVVEQIIEDVRILWTLQLKEQAGASKFQHGQTHWSSQSYQQNLKQWNLMKGTGMGVEIQVDLIRRLQKRLEWIMEMHKFTINTFQAVFRGKSMERTAEVTVLQKMSMSSNALRLTLLDTWNAMQNELKNVLYQYLTETAASVGTAISLQDSTVEQRILFKFGLAKSTKEDAIGVNGLYTKDNIKSLPTKDMITTENAGKAVLVHRLFGQSTIFNLPNLFKLTFDFVSKMEAVYLGRVERKSEIHGFLSGTLSRVFIPQFEMLVVQRFHECVNSSDAFRTGNQYHHGQVQAGGRPLLRNTESVLDLIKDLCVSVYRIPVQQQEFLKILETLLIKYLEACRTRFQSYATGIYKDSVTEERIGLASGYWLKNDELVAVLRQSSKSIHSQHAGKGTQFETNANKQELNLLLYKYKTRLLRREDLITDLRKIDFIAHLYTSLVWFVEQVQQMRILHKASSGCFHLQSALAILQDGYTGLAFDRTSSQPMKKSIVNSATNNKSQVNDDEFLRKAIRYSLPEEHVKSFDTVLSRTNVLAEFCLFLMRTEIKAHVIFYLQLTFSEGNFSPEESSIEPDSNIMTLNQDLVAFHNLLRQILNPKDLQFVMDGVGHMVQHLVIQGASMIKSLNRNGLIKLQRDILALQHNLSLLNGQYEQQLDQCLQYYRLFNVGGYRNQFAYSDNAQQYQSLEKMLQVSVDYFLQCVLTEEETLAAQFTYEQYKTALDLLCQPILQYHDHPNRKIYDDAYSKLRRHFNKK